MTDTINGIRLDAPLWMGATPDEIRAIKKLLSNASFHYADDSASEWGAGKANINEAAKEINRLGLGCDAINALARGELVNVRQITDAVLRDARQERAMCEIAALGQAQEALEKVAELESENARLRARLADKVYD